MSRRASDELVTWVDACLAEHGIERTDDLVTTRERSWSTVHRVETSRGRVWIKEAPGGASFETDLYALLVDLAPDRVLHPYGVDTGRGWLVLPDGGPTLDEQIEASDGRLTLASTMPAVLEAYGRVQRAVATEADAMVVAGVPDMRAARLAERFDEALEAVRPFAHDDPDRRRTIDRVAALRSWLVDASAELGEAPGGTSLDHNDLHHGNVLVSDPASEREIASPRFYDWGDAVVAHAFGCLLFPLDVMGTPLGTPDGDRVRDGYLAAFDDVAEPDALRRGTALALRLAVIPRTLVWVRALADGTEPDFVAEPFNTLVRLLDEA